MNADTFPKVSNVILDDDNDDDGEEFLIEEAPKDPLVSLEAGEEAAVEAGGQEHGALVQQILETQKELQDGNKRDKKGVEIVSEHSVWIFLTETIFDMLAQPF